MRQLHPFIRLTDFRRAWYVLALLLCGLSGTATADPGAFLVRARVLEAEPVVESVPVPLATERCTYSKRAARADRAMAGDVRSSRPGLTIGNGVAEEIRHRHTNAHHYRCRHETEWEYRDEVVAYRVYYEYDGGIFERLFSEHPGDWIDLKVKLSTR